MNWVCDCGIVNPHGEQECGQCGELRADSWAAADRASVIAVRVLDVTPRKSRSEANGVFYDRCYQLQPRSQIRDSRLRSLCHQPFVQRAVRAAGANQRGNK